MTELEEFKKEVLSDPEVKKEYEALGPEYDIIQAMIDARVNQNITQKELSERTGITQADISRIERGTRNPSLAMMKRIAAGLGMQLKLEFIPVPTEKGISGIRVKSGCDKPKLKVSQIDKSNITDELVDNLLFTNIEDDKRAVDCIIVLGSRKASQYRVPVAVREYQKGRAAKMIFCGGSVRDFAEGSMQEAEHMYRTAIAMGVRKEDIILEKRSTNTVENILGALMELQSSFWLNKINRVLLVTTTYHMRRSFSIARYLFPKHIEIIPCPADDKNTRRSNWMNSEEGRIRAISEVKSIITCVEQGVFPDFEI